MEHYMTKNVEDILELLANKWIEYKSATNEGLKTCAGCAVENYLEY